MTKIWCIALIVHAFFSGHALYATAVIDQCDKAKDLSDWRDGRPVDISPWDFASKNINVSVLHLLPKSFVNEVEAKVGKVGVSVNYTEYGDTPTIEIWVNAQGKLIAEFVLQPGPADSDVLILNGLRLENPIPEQQVGNLKLDQKNKGLPPAVFAYAKGQVLELLKSSPYSRLSCLGAQNYAVLALYRRSVGMEPANTQSQIAIAMLDSYYKIARNELPPPYRIKSLQDFTVMLGGTDSQIVSPELEQIWTRYLQEKILPPGYSVFTTGGRPVALLTGNQAIFIDQTASPTKLFDWNDFAGKGNTALIMNVPIPK